MEKNRYNSGKEWIKQYNEEMSKYVKGKKVLIKKEDDLINILAGYRAFLICAVNHSGDEKFTIRAGNIIKRIERQILFIEKGKQLKEI